MFFRIFSILALSAFCALGLQAQSLEEARIMAEDGNTDDAIEMLRTLEAAQPKNPDISLEIGRLMEASGNYDGAREAYSEAHRKGSNDALIALANLACQRFETDEATGLLEQYRESLKPKGRGRKARKAAPDNSGNLQERIERVENLLARVENIEIIDSLTVDAEDFFRAYRLSPSSGSLRAPGEVLPADFPVADQTVVYQPESQREMLWAAPDTAGVFQLYSASALYGDNWEAPRPLGDHLGEGGDANYPFLMPDGVTLYFANDGENSIGGLDIFIARRSDDGFLQPQNLGLPYNSPYDDYMLAIDELTGLGWWATDRHHIPGKVTVYIFIPSDLRQNIDPEDSAIASRARIDAIADTWRPDTDRDALRQKILALGNERTTRKQEFLLSVPGRGVYTSYADFRTAAARDAMHEYMDQLAKYRETMSNLAMLRRRFAKGDADSADLILQAESQLDAARAELQTLRNDVITLER